MNNIEVNSLPFSEQNTSALCHVKLQLINLQKKKVWKALFTSIATVTPFPVNPWAHASGIDMLGVDDHCKEVVG